MSKKEIKTLSSKRGWGPKIVDNLLAEVGKIIKPQKQIIDTEKIREDDIPLDDENYPVD